MKEIQASEDNRKGKKNENSHILVGFYFAMQMKVANCSLDQNPTLIWSSPKKSEPRLLSKMGVSVKVTQRPVAPPCAPMKKFIKWKKFLSPSSIRSQSFKSISELEKKLCLFQKVPFSALFCVVFGFFHLLGRGDPPDPEYYNKFWVFRGQECHKMFNLGFQNFFGNGLWLPVRQRLLNYFIGSFVRIQSCLCWI